MSSGGESRRPKFSEPKGRRSGLGAISPSGLEERGSGRVGVVIWSAAREGIAGAPFVLPSSSGADGLSGSAGGSFSWGDHIGSGSCGPFGRSS